jgi:signal-transduction protein with cAMP-binding, CBS, and nucleotidyltransferase domain
VKELPLIEKEEFRCLINEDILLNNDLSQKIKTYRLPYHSPIILEGDHFFDIVQKISANKLTVIPVVEKEGRYIGCIAAEQLLHYIGSSYSFNEPGSILILETDRQNYSLGEIARIAESENSHILSTFIMNDDQESTKLFITVKFSTFDLSKLISAYQRYDYVVNGSFSEVEFVDYLQDRYDSLMNYLNI